MRIIGDDRLYGYMKHLSPCITTHIPSFINYHDYVAHTELWIFDFFVNSQSEQILMR